MERGCWWQLCDPQLSVADNIETPPNGCSKATRRLRIDLKNKNRLKSKCGWKLVSFGIPVQYVKGWKHHACEIGGVDDNRFSLKKNRTVFQYYECDGLRVAVATGNSITGRRCVVGNFWRGEIMPTSRPQWTGVGYKRFVSAQTCAGNKYRARMRTLGRKIVKRGSSYVKAAGSGTKIWGRRGRETSKRRERPGGSL